VRRTYSNHGDRCFAAVGPKLWNSLPYDMRQADTSFHFQRFKRLLKTFLLIVGVLRSQCIVTNCVKAAPHEFSYFLTYLYRQSTTAWKYRPKLLACFRCESNRCTDGEDVAPASWVEPIPVQLTDQLVVFSWTQTHSTSTPEHTRSTHLMSFP